MKSALSLIENADDFEAAANEILSHPDEYDVAELILPYKRIFGECGYIISRMPIDFIEKNAVALLRWFQDPNWPGFQPVLEALRKLPANVLIPALNQAIEEAQKANDEEWIFFLKEEFADDLL